MKLFDDGGSMQNLVTSVNERSNADFVRRLLDPNRAYIQDWNNPNNVATHKLGYAEDKDGAIVFPLVQNINGKLHDFTDPKYKHGKWDALDSAIERGDTLRMSTKEAEQFTKNYKKYYPKGNYKKRQNWLINLYNILSTIKFSQGGKLCKRYEKRRR